MFLHLRHLYTPARREELQVVNRYTRDGKPHSIKGKAKATDPLTNAKTAVTFIWPISGDYWIIELRAAYEYAVVSEPHRSYLCVLSRTIIMEDRVYAGIIERLRGRWFQTDSLVRTEQKGN
jgi:apolipoprotein D and lipocalin family protein